MSEKQPVFRRILLKLSGEALRGDSDFGVDAGVLGRIAAEIESVLRLGVQIAIVVGGGNLFRGATLSKSGLGHITGDQMGMLATMMNALAMRDVFGRNHVPTRVMSAISMMGVIDHYDRRKAMYHLSLGRVMVFAGGTGNPLVTTDSAASLRAIEVGADILLKATNVNGIYSKDPNIHSDAVHYDHLSYREVLARELGVMDLSAFCQARDHHLPIRIFNLEDPGALLRIVLGAQEGTLVDSQEDNVL